MDHLILSALQYQHCGIKIKSVQKEERMIEYIHQMIYIYSKYKIL